MGGEGRESKAKLSLKPHIFYFGIDTGVAITKIEFANNVFHKGIELNFQT